MGLVPLSLLLLAVVPTMQSNPCGSCTDPGAAVVRRGGSIDGIPIDGPLATEVRTADGARTVWAAPEVELVGPRVATVTEDQAIAAVV